MDCPRPVSTAAPLVFLSVGIPLAKRPPSCGPPPKLGALVFPCPPAEDEAAAAGLPPGMGGLAIEPVGALGLTANNVQ